MANQSKIHFLKIESNACLFVYKVTPGINKIFSLIASLKTYSTGKQQNETGYFCGMTLIKF